MARNKKVLITRSEFCDFHRVVERLQMEDKFRSVILYNNSIYFESSHSYLSWNKDALLETLKTILIGINAMFNTNFSLVEDR